MNIYLLTQTDNTDYGTYTSCVVYAEATDTARLIMPCEGTEFGDYTWATSPDNVTASFLGTASKNIIHSGVVLASFNA